MAPTTRPIRARRPAVAAVIVIALLAATAWVGSPTAAADDLESTASAPTTERVSVKSDGAQPTYPASFPLGSTVDSESISGDGRYVAFTSDATNLVPGDTNAAT